jgi:hypothetical protein
MAIACVPSAVGLSAGAVAAAAVTGHAHVHLAAYIPFWPMCKWMLQVEY